MLNPEQLEQVKEAIQSAENLTSGEIRVCVARNCKGDPLEAAESKFKFLKMEETQLRNGILIYVCPSDHKAAIFGDQGINEAAHDNFWHDALEEMLSYFRKGLITEGICQGVGKVGNLIKARYPICENDQNELCDEVIMED